MCVLEELPRHVLQHREERKTSMEAETGGSMLPGS